MSPRRQRRGGSASTASALGYKHHAENAVIALSAQGADVAELTRLACKRDPALATELQALGYNTVGSRLRVEHALRAAFSAGDDSAEDDELALEENKAIADAEDELELEDNTSPVKVSGPEEEEEANVLPAKPREAPPQLSAPQPPMAVDGPPEALRFKERGNVAFADGLTSVALDEYRHALKVLGANDHAHEGLRVTLYACMTQCHIQRGEWWDAVFMSHRAGAADPTQRSPQALKARMRYSKAAMELGLLAKSAEGYQFVTAHSVPGSQLHSTATEQLAEVATRLTKLADGTTLADEVETLRMGLGENAARVICEALQDKCASDDGRAQLLRVGFLETSDEGMGGRVVGQTGKTWRAASGGESPAAVVARTEVRRWLRACQRSLLYQVNQRLQRTAHAATLRAASAPPTS